MADNNIAIMKERSRVILITTLLQYASQGQINFSPDSSVKHQVY
jgi:hypothetical protein